MEFLTISAENILVDQQAGSGEEIIRKLGGLLYNNGYVKESYTNAALEREKVFPTGLQTASLGFAIPHTDAVHVIRSTVAVATLTRPVLFKAMDNPDLDIQVNVVLMLAISDPKMVVDTLTKVISILEDQEAIAKIKKATTKEEVQNAVQEHIRKVTAQKSDSTFHQDIGH
jgi:PTS system galactitol-specific IIA component